MEKELIKEINYKKARCCYNCKHMNYNDETRENICTKHNIDNISIFNVCKNFAKEKIILPVIKNDVVDGK